MRTWSLCRPWAVVWLVAAAGCFAGQSEEAAQATADLVFAPPGSVAYPETLQQELRRALAALGPDYQPRTRHLRESGFPEYCNRLLLESSPYLRQHAHNPVNWYPWGDEAFEAARRLGRPVLLSIGYSTCHWCHVMEEESFEDEEIAAYLNANYIAIKVDREERPDIDAIYMKAVQMLTGRGGWPMTTWLTPAARPFYGGTYFPARDGDRGSRKGFLTLLRELKRFYDQQPEQAAERAAEITRRLQVDLGPAVANAAPGESSLAEAMRVYVTAFDGTEGGLNRAPKFPSSLPVLLLLRESWRTDDERLLAMARLTLSKMAGGGIYDQVGGGFHRYSVDGRWLVPHFEKMLYDNALLVPAYLEAYQITDDPSFARVAEDVLRYALREMRSPEGAFFSATDADSLNPRGEREEGWFFTWTPDELRTVVGQKAGLLEAHYGVTAEGNFEGRNILHVARALDQVAAELNIEADRARRSLVEARGQLYRVRQSRPPPLLDDKVLTAWNGLFLSALARGGFVLREEEFVERAEQAAAFLLERLRKDKRLLRSYHEGRARFNAYLNDYAFLIAGLIDLYQASHDVRWLREAIELQAVLDRHYWDAKRGGYFMTSDDHETLLTREKPAYDGAVPSGNSVALMNLVRLEALTLDDAYRQRADALLQAFASRLGRSPTALNVMLLALQFRLAQPREIVIVTPDTAEQARPFLDVLRQNYLPTHVLVVAVEGANLEAQRRSLPALSGKVARDGRATAYVCRQGTCRLPVTDPVAFTRQLMRPTTPADAAEPEE